MKYLIEVFWSDEDRGYIATAPDLPGCSAWGATLAEAASEIEHAQQAWLEARSNAGEPIPEATTKARCVAA